MRWERTNRANSALTGVVCSAGEPAPAPAAAWAWAWAWSGPRRIREPQTIAPNRKSPATHQNATVYPWTTAVAVTDPTTDGALCGARWLAR